MTVTTNGPVTLEPGSLKYYTDYLAHAVDQWETVKDIEESDWDWDSEHCITVVLKDGSELSFGSAPDFWCTIDNQDLYRAWIASVLEIDPKTIDHLLHNG